MNLPPDPLPPLANLLAVTQSDSAVETIEILLQTTDVRIERIISRGQASPAGFWYDQDEAEWVNLLAGQAVLRFEEGSVTLGAGDHLFIAPHRRHRVESTSPDAIWLAVFTPAR